VKIKNKDEYRLNYSIFSVNILHSTSLISIAVLLITLSIIINPTILQSYLQTYTGKDELLVKETTEILSNIFQIDMTKYRLDRRSKLQWRQHT